MSRVRLWRMSRAHLVLVPKAFTPRSPPLQTETRAAQVGFFVASSSALWSPACLRPGGGSVSYDVCCLCFYDSEEKPVRGSTPVFEFVDPDIQVRAYMSSSFHAGLVIVQCWARPHNRIKWWCHQMAEDSLQTLEVPPPDPSTPHRVFLEVSLKEGLYPMMPHSMYCLPLWPGITLVLLTKVCGCQHTTMHRVRHRGHSSDTSIPTYEHTTVVWSVYKSVAMDPWDP